MQIHVCSLANVPKAMEAVRPSRLVTLLTAGTPFERPAGIAPENHLLLSMNDIAVAQDGLVLPGREHVERLLEFVSLWDQRSPLLIHCFAGISRSTAAAYIAAAALSPDRDEVELAKALRQLSPSATPNPRLIEHGDAILGRNGRMVGAIRAIGRGCDAYEGNSFALPLKL